MGGHPLEQCRSQRIARRHVRDYPREAAALIERLRSPDFENRERAVKALAALGEVALPALKALAADGDEDIAWWAKAAIQGVHRGRKKVESPHSRDRGSRF